ncbi:MAG: FecR family protein [Chitinophagales bacterium]
MKKYVNYSVEDFATDNHFRKWILRGGSSEDFWQHFLSDHPEKKNEVHEAAQLVRLLQFCNTSTSADKELQQTLKKINTQPPIFNRFSFLQYAAAVFLFICISSVVYFTLNRNQITHATNFGEKKNVVLPDGSEIMLNANSSIRYTKDWKDALIKEVTLQGEAFFEVVHQRNNAKFVVHTSTFDVEVLGTSFNLINRPSKHQVMLKEGKVEVHFIDKTDDFVSFLDTTEQQQIHQNKTLQLSPNQLFEVSLKERTIVRKEVNPTDYTAWLSNKFVCNQLPLADLALFIEDNYGWEVKTMDTELLSQKINGTIPTNNIDVLLDALPFILETKMVVDKQKKEIIFTDNPS